jgi:hypothetical protein
MGRYMRTALKISKADDGGWKAVMYNVDGGGGQSPSPQ